jgi:DNA-binding GntR family transcriptional regulator
LIGVYETKANYVFDYLKEKILQGFYKQGESIVISRVAEELELSAIPVREAIKRLESEGLVELTPHKGAQVTTFSTKKINDILEVRAVLEGYAAREACEFMDSKLIDRLKQINKNLYSFAVKGEDENFSNTNMEFHRFLYQFSKNKMLFESIFNLWEGGKWSKSLFAYYPEKMIESVKEHDDIIEAIQHNQPDKVEELTRKHKMKNIPFYLDLQAR